MNCFTCSKEDNYWIVSEDHYNEEFNNWQGPIHNVQLRLQNLKEKRKTEDTCTKYSGSDKFNGIPREGNPAITIKSYKDQCRNHTIRNGVWDLFSLPDPQNEENKWDLLLHWSRFPLKYMKRHVKIIQKSSEVDQYVDENLM